MTLRLDTVIRVGCLDGCLFLIAGCRREPEAGEGRAAPAALGIAALQTHARYVKAVNAGIQARSEEIGPEYWTERIQKLHPLRVYLHRGNMVVVQRVSRGRQEGKYICLMISSYGPRTGEDGFTFTEAGNSVYDFTRVTND